MKKIRTPNPDNETLISQQCIYNYAMDWAELLRNGSQLFWTAVVSATVSGIVSYILKRREIRFNLSAEYEYEQRKKLRSLIGHYHGRVLQAVNRMNYRFWNLYQYHGKGWLNVDGNYTSAGLYFSTTVHRFLHVCTLARRFEAESLYIDARISERNDHAFVNYLSAFIWCLTTASLYKGFEYAVEKATDHFFGDELRLACDACWKDEQFVSLEVFLEQLKTDRSLDRILAFFDGINPQEPRLRWDKVVAFHLLLMAFLNRFGYETQRSTRDKFLEVVEKAHHLTVLQNLVQELDKLGLGKDREASNIAWAVQVSIQKNIRG